MANATLPQGKAFPSISTSTFTAIDFDLLTSKAILNVYSKAFFMGKIDANKGIKVPTDKAKMKALNVGKTDISTSKIPFKALETIIKPKILKVNPITKAGKTNDNAWTRIKDTTPTLFKPNVLKTASSKFLVSTETNNKLYKSIKLNIKRINTIIFKITPKNIAPNLVPNSSYNTGNSISIGYTPSFLEIILAFFETSY